jgi:hypothetical protein
MNNPPYCMPVHGTDKAPKFDDTMANLIEFLNVYDMHTDEAGLQAGDCIKQLLCYLKVDERELWLGLPQATSSDYDKFIKEVKVMYPGCEGDHHYSVVDLQAVM